MTHGVGLAPRREVDGDLGGVAPPEEPARLLAA